MPDNELTKHLFHRLLVDCIDKSKFTKLSMEYTGDGEYSVILDGQCYGLIGAIAKLIRSLSNDTGISIPVILQMISSYNECVGVQKISSKPLYNKEDEIEPLLDLFTKYIKDVKGREGEN